MLSRKNFFQTLQTYVAILTVMTSYGAPLHASFHQGSTRNGSSFRPTTDVSDHDTHQPSSFAMQNEPEKSSQLIPYDEKVKRDFFECCKKGMIEEIEPYITKYEGILHAKNEFGSTVLHISAFQGNLKIVKYVVKKGADLNAETNSKWTPLHVAMQNNRTKIVHFLLDQEGLDVDRKDKAGVLPLHIATYKSRIDTVARLLKINAKVVNEQANSGWSPLDFAVHMGHVEMVKLLLQYRADVNKKNKRGRSPLHMAAAKGDQDMVMLLVENGANENAVEKAWRTPLMLADEKGNKEVVDYLVGREKRLVYGYVRALEKEVGNTEASIYPLFFIYFSSCSAPSKEAKQK